MFSTFSNTKLENLRNFRLQTIFSDVVFSIGTTYNTNPIFLAGYSSHIFMCKATNDYLGSSIDLNIKIIYPDDLDDSDCIVLNLTSITSGDYIYLPFGGNSDLLKGMFFYAIKLQFTNASNTIKLKHVNLLSLS